MWMQWLELLHNTLLMVTRWFGKVICNAYDNAITMHMTRFLKCISKDFPDISTHIYYLVDLTDSNTTMI